MSEKKEMDENKKVISDNELFLINEFDLNLINIEFAKIKEELKKGPIDCGFINMFLEQKIEFKTFLKLCHEAKLKQIKTFVLFNDGETYKKALNHYFNNPDNYRHEMEHWKRAKKYGIMGFYGICVKSIGRGNEVSLNPSTVSLVEKKALDEGWTLEKYLDVSDYISLINGASDSDKYTVKINNKIRNLFGLEIKNHV